MPVVPTSPLPAGEGQGEGRSSEEMSIARMLALAFPERIGKARGAPGQFLLANGRGANLDAAHPLARSPYLVAAELSGSAASTRILLAAAADEADVILPPLAHVSASRMRSNSTKASVRCGRAVSAGSTPFFSQTSPSL